MRDRISSVPSIEINRNYFNERNEYIGELVLPDDGSPLEIVLPEEAIPSYTLDDTKIYLNPCAGYCSDGSLIIGFSTAGNHTVEFRSLDDGSNLDLSVALTFIVKSNAKPENLTPVLSGVPEDDMLISDHQSKEVTIDAEESRYKVEWSVSSSHPDIKFRVFSPDDSSISIDIWNNKKSIAAAITVKAWYYGYEDYAAVKTF